MTQRIMKFILALAFLLPISAQAQENKTSSDETQIILTEIIAGDARSDDHKRRDQYRHPFDTLTFFGLEPNLTVVEIWPGGQGSWYRGIIEPLITEGGGTYIPVPYVRNSPKDFLNEEENVPYGEVDMVFVFRAHGFMMYQKPSQGYLNSLFTMLKPGGVLSIVDHAGDEAIAQDPEGDNGYVNESHFRMMAEEAGFIYLADSQVNRNPNDIKDHPEGVWSLPPRLKATTSGTEERQKYLDIGESDRFTLKFYKPEE